MTNGRTPTLTNPQLFISIVAFPDYLHIGCFFCANENTTIKLKE